MCLDRRNDMNQEYELIRHAKIKHLHTFLINITYRNFHMHSDFELLFILKGSGTIRLKNDNFAVSIGDIFLINPNEMHEINAEHQGMDIVIVQISRHFLGEYFPRLRNTRFRSPLICNFLSDNESHFFTQAALHLCKSYIKGEDCFVLDCILSATQLLKLLYQKVPYEVLDEAGYQEQKKRSERINRIAAYIDENYLYPIHLQDIAVQENISTTHLSHFFSDNFGITFQDYLTEIRLEHALLLMENGDYSLTALSELSGFSDPKYLRKSFLQKFGYPYSPFQKSTKQIPDKSVPHTHVMQYYYTRDASLQMLNQWENYISAKAKGRIG